ncbi:MAG: glucosaminidase domain-containing protein [Flavobacteriales bacterium]
MQSNTLHAILFSTALLAQSVVAQSQPSEPRMSKVDYISKYADQAVREMHSSGVPASITLAQGMLESDYGNSPLAKYANNHFGIKCHKGWEGPTFIQDDDEKNECFRKYYEAYDSYRDHSEFLSGRDRYAFLFDLKTTDYKGWARGLKSAGYATNPKYADLLIRIIEENELHKYDEIVKIKEGEVADVKVSPSRKHDSSTPKVMEVRSVNVSDNNIKFVNANSGDTPASIAKKYNMGLWQILKYNDLAKNDVIMPGDIVYLQPKRNYAKEDSHAVQAGESMRSISQQYGVKMKKLRKINGLSESYVPQAGDVIKLRKMSHVNEVLTGR